jgi:outer membrane protein insertion porin family
MSAYFAFSLLLQPALAEVTTPGGPGMLLPTVPAIPSATSSATSSAVPSTNNAAPAADNAAPATPDASANSSAAPAADIGNDSTKIGSIGSQNLTVDEVKIEGNRLVPAEDIMNVVKTKRGDRFDREVVMQDLKAINNMGYFDDRNLQVVPELTTGGVLLKIRVQENAPITQFSFDGNKVLSTDEIEKSFEDQLGKPQNLGSLSSAIDKVEQAYHEKGYVLAKVSDVKDDPDGSVGLKINEGVVDKIEITGNHKTKDFIIRNAIKLKPGSVYNEHQLTTDLRKLYANGYFQDVRRSLSPSSDNPDHFVLKVEVEEKRSGSVGLGGGVDTLFGPFGQFSIGDNNFRGRGEILNFTNQLGAGLVGPLNNALNNGGTNSLPSKTTYQSELSFVEPNLGGTNTSLGLTAFGRELPSFMISQAMQQTLGVSATLSKPLGHNILASLGFTADNTTLQDVSSYWTSSSVVTGMTTRALMDGYANTVAGATALTQTVRDSQLKGGAYLSATPSIAYDTRDAKIDPTTGTLLRITGSPSLGLTNTSFVKLGASASKFIKVNESTTIATNVQGGTALGGSMPQFGMFNLGGFNGIRGYKQFSTLGTGTGMLMGTAEVRTRVPFLHTSENKVAKAIDQHLKVTAWFDAGQVTGNNTSNALLGRSMMGASVGVGIRVKVPMVGMVRLDYGFPLISTILGNRTPQINVGFGEKF